MKDAVSIPGASQALATYDNRPYFARALDHGLKNGLIDSEKLDAMRADGAKGVVQIADFFGTAHLRTDLDDAVKRMVTLASLYLEHMSDGNLHRAARSLQENSFLSHSRGGSQMLKALFAMPTDNTIPDPTELEDSREFLRERSLEQPWTRMAGGREGGLLSAEALKAFLKACRQSKKMPAFDAALLEDVPAVHRAVVGRHMKLMIEKDLPRIKNPKVAFNDLVREYHDRFHPLSLSVEISDYDALVTDEWRRVTQGMTDSDSMNTIFLCLAAGKPPKPAISAAEAKAAIIAIRDNGPAQKIVREFILTSAPHQMIDGLISLWEDEFFPDVIEVFILEDQDDSPERVVRVLAEHCHIKAAAKAPAKQSAAKKIATEKASPKKATAKTATPKKAIPRKTIPQKATAKKPRP